MLIFIEGRDKVGKTTVIKTLKNRNKDYINLLSIDIKITPDEWFHSDIKSLIEKLFNCLEKIIKQAKEDKTKLWITDKGPFSLKTRMEALIKYMNIEGDALLYLEERFQKIMLDLNDSKFIWIDSDKKYVSNIKNEWSEKYNQYQKQLFAINNFNKKIYKSKIDLFLNTVNLIKNVDKIEDLILNNEDLNIDKSKSISPIKFLRNSHLRRQDHVIKMPVVPPNFFDDYIKIIEKYGKENVLVSGSCLYGLNNTNSDLDIIILTDDNNLPRIIEEVSQIKFNQRIGINVIDIGSQNFSIKNSITLWVYSKITYSQFLDSIGIDKVINAYEENKMLYLSNRTKNIVDQKQYSIFLKIILERFLIFEPSTHESEKIIAEILQIEKKEISYINIINRIKELEELWK